MNLPGFTAEVVVFSKKETITPLVTEEFPFLVTKISPYYDR